MGLTKQYIAFLQITPSHDVPLPSPPSHGRTCRRSIILRGPSHCQRLSSDHERFELMVDLPGEGLSAQMRFSPVLDVPSEIIEVRYALPFGLDVAPQDQMCKCTKDGKGGEKVGDILRFCSQWTLGLPRGDGAVTTVASFGGTVSWQVSMFDVMKTASWDEVVTALTSNVP